MRLLPATVAAIVVLAIAAPTVNANPADTTTTPTSAPDHTDKTTTTTTTATPTTSTNTAATTADPGDLAETNTITYPTDPPLFVTEITSAPTAVIAGEPFTISGVCRGGLGDDLLIFSVSTADLTQPNWIDQLLSRDDKPAGDTVTTTNDDATFTHTFETSDVVRTVHIGATCNQEPCSDIVGQGCDPFAPISTATVNIVAPGTEIPTTVPVATVDPNGQLPDTGTTTTTAWIGMATLAAGLALLATARLRTRHPSTS